MAVRRAARPSRCFFRFLTTCFRLCYLRGAADTSVIMETILEFFHRLGHLNELISWGGLVVLVVIVFAETGLLVGFVLPGDSLLVTAGLFAWRGDLSIGHLILSLTAATILGDNMGY